MLTTTREVKIFIFWFWFGLVLHVYSMHFFCCSESLVQSDCEFLLLRLLRIQSFLAFWFDNLWICIFAWWIVFSSCSNYSIPHHCNTHTTGWSGICILYIFLFLFIRLFWLPCIYGFHQVSITAQEVKAFILLYHC